MDKITFWKECLRLALKSNDTMYAMHCNEQLYKLKQKQLNKQKYGKIKRTILTPKTES